MRILVLNSGSATVKFQVIEPAGALEDGSSQRKLARGLVDRIGGAASFRFEAEGRPESSTAANIPDHEGAVRLIVDRLRANGIGQDLDGVGHRVVHGGEIFTSAVLLDDDALRQIDTLSDLAPLHNPAAVSGIRTARKVFGGTMPMVAVFDTSFHRFLPEEASTYAIPRELTEKYRIRRYSFHGLAHQYSLLRYAELAAIPTDTANIVTLHLGNGCSATAIRAGRSVDTSMGFTPLEGLIMGTRSGDLDPALINYLARKEGLTIDAIETMLNKRSGLLGLSGRSHDMRDLSVVYDSDQRARLAIDAFCYRARNISARICSCSAAPKRWYSAAALVRIRHPYATRFAREWGGAACTWIWIGTFPHRTTTVAFPPTIVELPFTWCILTKRGSSLERPPASAVNKSGGGTAGDNRRTNATTHKPLDSNPERHGRS